MTSPPLVLTIAGSDPNSGAGVQADLRTLSAIGVCGVSVVTALTVQNSYGVQSVSVADANIVADQLLCVLKDARPDAVKIGMLGGAAQVQVVADILKSSRQANIVLDPVLASTSGVPLLDQAGRTLLVSALAPLCTLVTPNQQERQLLPSFGPVPTLVKGGHLSGDPIDILITPNGEIRFDGPRIDTPHTHGTGCLLSSAIAGYLAQGYLLVDAIRAAKTLLTRALQTPAIVGGGRGYPDALAASGFKPAVSRDAHTRRLAKLRGIYVVTDPHIARARSAEDIVQSALDGGATVVQLRDKIRSTPDLIALAKRLKSLTQAFDTLLIVNDRVDVALASDADGVHLGPEDMSPQDARRLLGDDRLVGISASTPKDAQDGASFASYLGVGAVYGTSTKTDAGPPIGIAGLARMHASYPALPIIGIGGITLENITDVAATGVAGAAVVSAVLRAASMTDAVRVLAQRFAQGVPRP